MKSSSKIVVISVLAVLSLFVLPACGLLDGVMEKAGTQKWNKRLKVKHNPGKRL